MDSGKQAEAYRTETVPADYFDNEGCAELTRTLSQLSQPQLNDAQGATTGDRSSALGTLVEDGAEEDKFDFEDRVRTALDRMDEEGIKHRSLGVGFDRSWSRRCSQIPRNRALYGLSHSMGAQAERVATSACQGHSHWLYGYREEWRDAVYAYTFARDERLLANQRQGYHEVLGDVSYDGMRPEHLAKHYRGDVDVGYSPEDDTHFPSLSVKDTLTVASKMRAPQTNPIGVVQTLATVFGLRHTFNTPVGNEAIRGVSGGEKKRVSIAEMMASRVRIGCWDNSTRGLDSSTALEFGRALRIATDVGRATTVVSIYQASESLYKLFDKVCIIYAGRQIYYGPAEHARQYFVNMGWEPAPRQTTPDFLVAVTDPLARTPRAGWENRVPRTADEFVAYWNKSPEGQVNQADAMRYLQAPDDDVAPKMQLYKESARAERAKTAHPKSSYTVSLAMQVRGIMLRRLQILRGDMAAQIVMNVVFMLQAVIMGSVFLKMPAATSAYFSRGGVLFFSVLFGALSGMPLCVSDAWHAVRLQTDTNFIDHPFVEALALTVVDIPITFVTQVLFGIILYWMTGLQKDAAKFFIFVLFTFLMSLTMKAFFRGIAASFARESTAQAVAGISTLILVLYTGYTIPKPTMIGALKWLTYINPVRYGFEALIVNEFHGLEGECSSLIPSGPGYEGISLQNQVCTTVGSVPGQLFVDGDAFAAASYDYHYKNLWMNFGIVIAFWVAFVAWFLAGTERAGHASGGATQLVFKQNAKIPSIGSSSSGKDTEKGSVSPDVVAEKKRVDGQAAQNKLVKANAVFSWHHLNYEIDAGGGKKRRLLDDISGFVAPGKMTALMGESGAGKTTLLNALAERISMGVITGDRLVNGNPLPKDFASQTGYVQQMDIHLESTTVREALMFSAQLRQPASVPIEENVEEVIKMCAMEAYADAIVGIVGEGLNVEQRKRLTIGVELAAKPQLLLFLDEPTSGLDSQSAWGIIEFLKSLADQGQAILCTIHQPSSELFQSFDRLLLLRRGGQTCYFGDLGENSSTLISYFEQNGARKCQSDENPAEYMLDVIGAGATATSAIDWHATWKAAPESSALEQELTKMHSEGRNNASTTEQEQPEYATGYMNQLSALLIRAFRVGHSSFRLFALANISIKHYSRNPTYIMGKIVLNVASGLFIGFTFFKANNSIQGSQNKLFAIFMSTIPAASLSNQLQVQFINFRNIYENREKQSKMYSWAPMVTLVELPYNIFGSSLYFLCWYWTVGYSSVADRAGYTVRILYPQEAVAAMSPNNNPAMVCSSPIRSSFLSGNGCGLLVNGIGNMELTCSPTEIQTIVPPSGQTCSSYMSQYISMAGGYLANPDASSDSSYADVYYRASLNMSYSHRWRNVGIMIAFAAFNVFLVYVGTWLFRVHRGNPFSRRK
ncbi:ABC multidrug transporter, putative [Rhizoctonia solani AG-1 IA]|uniref:ABC multidrug transporter, putative n=1 Tax=Thanatephorus cucumeris (strain AG1-IA) TaxID=983506 RepID=L8X1R9_THACA|nr:ABC multidrug transporter, putative [Rhizoctonia solani AG-1 IA]